MDGDGDRSLESNGKLNPNFITDPTSLPSDAGDEVFAYDAEGRRFETRSSEGTKRAVNDHRNPTGYSQKLDELTRDADAVGTPADGWEIERGYTIGLDVIAQSRVEGSHLPELFLYDTHGSVRGLLNLQGKTREVYDYDAFGVAGDFYTLNVNPSQASDRSPISLDQSNASSHLQYAGEFRTHSLGAYDLRARDFDATTGRFRTQDPTIFSPGDTNDANLFLYAAANPVYYTDPTGLFSVTELGFNVGKMAAKFGIRANQINGKYRSSREFIRVLQRVRNMADRVWDQVNTIRDMLEAWDDVEKLADLFAGELGSLAHMETSRVITIPNVIEDRIAKMWDTLVNKARVPEDFAEEFMGMFAASLAAKSLGFVSTPDISTRYRGTDGVLHHPDLGFLTLEAKGGNSTLKPGQMSLAWIKTRAERLAKKYKTVQSDDYASATNNKIGHAMVVRLDIPKRKQDKFRFIFQIQALNRMPDTDRGGWGALL